MKRNLCSSEKEGKLTGRVPYKPIRKKNHKKKIISQISLGTSVFQELGISDMEPNILLDTETKLIQ